MKKILDVRGEQAEHVLGMLKCVATADGTLDLHEIHKATLHAMSAHLFQSEIDVDQLEGTIEGAADRIVDVELRQEVMNMAGILPFLEEEHKEARVDVFARLGSAFGFNKKFARELHKLCHEAVVELTICMLRPSTVLAGRSLTGLTLKFAEGPLHMDGDKKVLAQYERYRDLDDDIFAKVLIKYYDDNNFPLPGTPHAPFSNGLKVHDMHHVLEGYPTTPLGETCIIAFDGALTNMDLGKALIAYVAQFQVGLQFDKSLPMWRNQFKPDIVIGAYERGGKCNTNFLELGFDWSDYLEQPLEDVRAQFNIVPEGMLMADPADLWCGDMGLVGERDSPDMVTQKATWLQKVFSGLNLKKD